MAAKQGTLFGCAALALGLSSMSAQAADPVLSFSSLSQPVQQGSVFDLDVLLSGVTDLYGYQFTLGFDSHVLQVVSISEGGFLASGGSTVGDTGVIDNAVGTVGLVYNSLVGAVPGVSGSGTLAHLRFQVLGQGVAALSFGDVALLDSQIGDLKVQVQGLSVTAVPEPASLLLLGAGVLALLGLARRRPAGAC